MLKQFYLRKNPFSIEQTQGISRSRGGILSFQLSNKLNNLSSSFTRRFQSTISPIKRTNQRLLQLLRLTIRHFLSRLHLRNRDASRRLWTPLIIICIISPNIHHPPQTNGQHNRFSGMLVQKTDCDGRWRNWRCGVERGYWKSVCMEKLVEVWERGHFFSWIQREWSWRKRKREIYRVMKWNREAVGLEVSSKTLLPAIEIDCVLRNITVEISFRKFRGVRKRWCKTRLVCPWDQKTALSFHFQYKYK